MDAHQRLHETESKNALAMANNTQQLTEAVQQLTRNVGDLLKLVKALDERVAELEAEQN